MAGHELRASRVTKVLGGSRVLRGVDAVFDGGRAHVLEGANGSGKSTLLAILGGRSTPSSGRAALVLGEDILGEGASLRPHVGWLGHELGLYPDLQAQENVELHAALRGETRAESWARHASRLGVDGLASRKVRELSRGQRQRVALVRALVGRPPVLLLDEPSTGLDTAGSALLVDVIGELIADGMIVVCVTHDTVFRDALRPSRWLLQAGQLRRDESRDGQQTLGT